MQMNIITFYNVLLLLLSTIVFRSVYNPESHKRLISDHTLVIFLNKNLYYVYIYYILILYNFLYMQILKSNIFQTGTHWLYLPKDSKSDSLEETQKLRGMFLCRILCRIFWNYPGWIFNFTLQIGCFGFFVCLLRSDEALARTGKKWPVCLNIWHIFKYIFT